MNPRFIDEINRLFDELVHDPWRERMPARPEFHRLAHGIGWEVEIPLQGVEHNDVSVTTDREQLTVRVRRHSETTTTEGGREVIASAQEQFRQDFVIPPGMELGGIESHFEKGLLRIRIALRRRPR
jgi:HSP20 family molecular chaperone IbpA